jgi:glycosyltransferase involved in cell wall biosynthesis
MRILQVSALYPPDSGGIAVCVSETTRRLATRGVAVEVLTVDHTGTLPAHETNDGAPVRRVRSWPAGADYRFAPGIAGQIRANQCELIHIQGYQTFVAPIAMLAAVRAGIPYVLTFHGGGHSSRWRHSIRGAQLHVLKPLLERAARLIATADWEVDHYAELLDLPRDLFIVIPNGGDLPSPQTSARTSNGTLIASLGRVERYKGHHRVLAALPHVLRELPDTHLWIAGEGPYAPELRQQVQELGVADRVEIRELADRQEYANRLAGVSLAVLLSDFETHPMAVLEAITLGVPTLVGDDRAGLSDLASKGLARVVPLNDPMAHAAAMLALLRDPPVRRNPGLPSWDDCVDALLDLYHDVRASQNTSRPVRRALPQSDM